jgi:glycosyltransferase involved in cell wall biosynthesis
VDHPRIAPAPPDKVAIVLPARNEAHCIASAIDAIACAARRSDKVSVHLVVVDDASDDATATVARAALAENRQSGVVVRTNAGTAARARRAGIEAVVRATPRPERCWLLSTDADSQVPVDWIERYLEHARLGEIAVAGVVDLIDDSDAVAFGDRWRADYGATLEVDGRHPHVHAANLGLRLDVYTLVGGFGAVERAEDIDLWRRLRSAGVEPLADSSIVVATSGRRQGRVEEGFAHALALAYPTDPATVSAVGNAGTMADVATLPEQP